MVLDPNNISSWPIQEQAKRLWQVEGGHGVSGLVHTMAWSDYGHGADDLGSLLDQATELAASVPDYESAAIDAGWAQRSDGGWAWSPKPLTPGCVPDEPEWDTADTAELACEASNVEPHDREVFEHWIVSDWLADQLAAQGEKVDKDFAGLTIWARTTTGQAVYADHVIEQIAKATYGREG